MTYLRGIEIDRARVNEETGEFRAVLFTDGEASDGHILNIEGGRIPDQMPLFVNHGADPRTQLGSLFFERKTPHTVQVRGQLFMDGTGPEAEIRRDLMAKIAAGHVSRLSGRWDSAADKVKPRTALDPSHPAYVNEKAKGAKRYGMYFEEWTAMEGSIVGLGADPQATMRWAEEAQSEAVAGFWRSVSETPETVSNEREVEIEEQPKPLTVADLEPLLDTVAKAIRGVDERLEALEKREQPEPTAEVSADDQSALNERIASLEAKLSELEGRETGAPSPPQSLREIFAGFQEKLAEDRQATIAALRSEVERRRGRIDDGEREIRANAERELRRLYGFPDPGPEEKGEAPVTAEDLVTFIKAIRKNRKALL